MSIKTNAIGILLIAIGALVYIFAPFSWFIQIESIEYSDICVGDTTQIATSERHAVWDIYGEAETLLIFYTEDNLRIETDIRRSAKYTYESDIKDVQFEVVWDKPVTKAGTYGVQSHETIYPFWFMPVRTTHKAIDRQFNAFNVLDCEE